MLLPDEAHQKFAIFVVRIGRDMLYYYLSEIIIGALAQLGERFAGSEEVSGSIPLCSTITD
jgi:hypothetical protein